MPTRIGRFEILSQIHDSGRTAIFKALDPANGRTIALKTLRLEPFGEQARPLVENLLQESQAGKTLKKQNIAVLYGAGEIDGLFCAEMEYVEGNSVATMQQRKEGFSIWDIMDITRQTCQGLDYANSMNLPHYTLEPAKIMVAWDGTVKLLGLGVSTMSAWAAQAAGAPPEILHYMSPEQLAGDPLDGRSNVFSVGAILYEMVTERKPFGGNDAAEVRQAILETIPADPDQAKRGIHPVLSQVIMKGLAKDPEQRFASGQELVKELDRCRENASVTAKPAKTVPTSKARFSAPEARLTQLEKFVLKNAVAQAMRDERKPPAEPAAPSPSEEKPAVHRAARAAAASASGSSVVAGLGRVEPQIASGPQISSANTEALELASASLTERPEVHPPKIAIDPLMMEGYSPATAKGPSFSEIDELPPLPELPSAPPPPPPLPDLVVREMSTKKVEPEKPKIQVRAAASRAIKEVRKTPPHLFLYSLSAAFIIILAIVAAIAYHVHSENSAMNRPPAEAAEPVPPSNDPGATAPSAESAGSTEQPAGAQAEAEANGSQPVTVSEKPRNSARKKVKEQPVPSAPVAAMGELTITSIPAGAQVQIDGQSNPAWVTPYDVADLQPGQHTVSMSKPGFATDSRTIEVASGSKSSLSVQLAPLVATVAVNSDPPGAEVWMDGNNTGKVTPAQFTVDKAGNHSFSLKKQGYLEENVSANLQFGQLSNVSSPLRALGNADDVKMSGKLKRIFGGSGDISGMGSVTIKTQPKGAQVSVNNRVLDKVSPLEFYLSPGYYTLDITLSGFQSLHRVITVEKGGKVVIEQSLDRE